MLSIIIATFNGETTLPLMLESLCELEQPSMGCEFIFVSNNSTDSTVQIVSSYADKLPIRVMEEDRQGKNFAVNLGLKHAKGDLILFTDDDIVASPGWLTAYISAAEQSPNADVLVGQVRHHWLKSPPSWLTRLADEGRAFGGTPTDLKPGSIKAKEIKGANFLVRKSTLARYRFNEAIGPNGTTEYVSGSETELLLRMEADECNMQYVPEALVSHIVKYQQVNLGTIMRRYFRIGRGIQSTGANRFNKDLPMLLGYPRFVYRAQAKSLLLAAYYLLTGNRYESVNMLMDTALLHGRVVQWKIDESRQAQ